MLVWVARGRRLRPEVRTLLETLQSLEPCAVSVALNDTTFVGYTHKFQIPTLWLSPATRKSDCYCKMKAKTYPINNEHGERKERESVSDEQSPESVEVDDDSGEERKQCESNERPHCNLLLDQHQISCLF